MSRLKRVAHILLSMVLAAAAGGVVWYYVRINTPSVKVVVAERKMPVGTVIGPGQVTLKDYPASAVPGEALSSLQEVSGKTVVSGTIFPGEVIRREHVAADTGSLKALLTAMAPGKEAIDLPADTAPGLKGVAAGDLVNIYTEIAVGKDITVVECVAGAAVILKAPALGPEKENSLEAASGKDAYVVAVTSEEAKKVAEGNVRGKKFSVSVLPPGGGQ
jgi:Flp pilus assembly protein CpaB